MNNLILMCLVLLVVVEAIQLVQNGIIGTRNLKNAHRDVDYFRERSDHFRDANLKLKDEIDTINTILKNTKLREFYNLGFAITPEGIKALPEGWQEVIERLKDSKK